MGYHDPEQQGEAMCKLSFKLEPLALVELDQEQQVSVASIREAVLVVLKKTGGKQAQAPPPGGELERLVQQSLHGIQGRA